jgi:hypothetical protein
MKKRIIRKKDRVKAFWLAVVASILLFISGTTGVASWTAIRDLVSTYIQLDTLNTLFILILIIASFGGIAVLFGGYLVLKEKVFLGNLSILFGSGAGIISLVINLLVSIFAFSFSIKAYLSFSSLGVLFALASRFATKTGGHKYNKKYKKSFHNFLKKKRRK